MPQIREDTQSSSKFSELFTRTSDKILRLFFPPKCIVCNKLLGYYSNIPYCHECFATLKDGKVCTKSEISLPAIDAVYVLYSYDNESVKHSVFHAKKMFSRPFKDFFASECRELFDKTDFISKIDLVTFATRRSSEKRFEGIDQAREMAKTISEVSNVPYCKTLVRVRRTQKQRSLSHEERARNVERAFRCTRNLNGKSVLLVDDVFTTGATLAECAKALRRAGAEKITVLSFSC